MSNKGRYLVVLLILGVAICMASCTKKNLPDPNLDIDVVLNQAGQILEQARQVGAPEIDPYNYRCAQLYLDMALEQSDQKKRTHALKLAQSAIRHGEKAYRNASAYHPSEQ